LDKLVLEGLGFNGDRSNIIIYVLICPITGIPCCYTLMLDTLMILFRCRSFYSVKYCLRWQ